MNDTMRVNMSVSDFVYFFTGSLKNHTSWFKEKLHQAFLCLIIILDRLTCAYVIEMRVHIHVGACDRNYPDKNVKLGSCKHMCLHVISTRFKLGHFTPY